jgi:hypothetical protein
MKFLMFMLSSPLSSKHVLLEPHGSSKTVCSSPDTLQRVLYQIMTYEVWVNPLHTIETRHVLETAPSRKKHDWYCLLCPYFSQSGKNIFRHVLEWPEIDWLLCSPACSLWTEMPDEMFACLVMYWLPSVIPTLIYLPYLHTSFPH